MEKKDETFFQYIGVFQGIFFSCPEYYFLLLKIVFNIFQRRLNPQDYSNIEKTLKLFEVEHTFFFSNYIYFAKI